MEKKGFGVIIYASMKLNVLGIPLEYYIEHFISIYNDFYLN